MTRITFVVLVLAATACGIPKDPEGTLETVSGGTTYAGASHSPPWVDLSGGEPAGIEVELIEAFASTIDADVEWVQGSVEELAAALHLGELHVVAAGIGGTSTLAAEITLSHPYLTTATVVGVPEGGPPPEDIAGLEVAAERGTSELGLLRKTDAEVVAVDDITAFDGARAVEDIFLEDLGLTDTGVRLRETDHVFGMPNGENAWITGFERFLLANADLAERLATEATP